MTKLIVIQGGLFQPQIIFKVLLPFHDTKCGIRYLGGAIEKWNPQYSGVC